MDTIQKIVSVEKPSPPNLTQQIIEQYCELGEQLGYLALAGERKLALLWKKGEEEIAFAVQFGNESEFIESLKNLFASGARTCVFVMSSASHTLTLTQLASLLLKNFHLGQRRFVLYDIESSSHKIIMNASQEKTRKRRKKILGKKGEHKVQD